MNKITIFSSILAILAGFSLFSFALAANEPPTWYSVSNQAVFAGDTVEFKVFAYDFDGDALIYSAVNLPAGASFNQRTRNFSWTPNSNQVGRHILVFRAFDGIHAEDLNVLVNVISSGSPNPPIITNPPPVIPPAPSPTGLPSFLEFNPPTIALEGQLYTYTVRAMGSQGSAVTYRLISSPDGMTINSQLGIIIWLPHFSQGRAEPYNITVGAANGQYEDTRSFKIFVQDVPQVGSQVVSGSGSRVTVPAPESLKISNVKAEKKNGDMVISWNTNKATRGRVIYDTVSQADRKENFTYKNATPDSPADKLLTSHTVVLKESDLEAGEKYYFRAVAKRNGETLVGEELSFETAAGEGLGLISSLGDFLGNTWFWIIVIIIVIFVIFRIVAGRSK